MPYAAFSFWYAIDESGKYHQDAPVKFIEKGKEIPAGIVDRLQKLNPEHMVDSLSELKDLPPTGLKTYPSPPKATEKKYTEEELFDLTKSEQIEVLEQLGQTSADIKTLRYEKDRVKKILELQK